MRLARSARVAAGDAAHAAAGLVEEGLARSREAVRRLGGGVERPYLVHHRHAKAAAAAGADREARQAALLAREALESALSGLSPEEYQNAIERVPEHREIIDFASRSAPKTVQALIPVIGAPLGGSIKEDELRLVNWTVSHPDDASAGSPVERRRTRALRLLTEARDAGVAPSLGQLADVLGVSSSTVRRDLEELRKAGHRVATRGQHRHVS